MFTRLTQEVRSQIDVIRAALSTHDRLRALVGQSADGDYAANPALDEIRASSPPFLDWRVYDHCAAFTRLYAVYERFVWALVEEWLRLLPTLFDHYSDLPESVISGHRTGVADVLQRLGGDRYAHLTEADVLRGIANGVVLGGSYSLLPDAFLIDDQNLWRETLQKLFRRIGIDDAWGWITRHRSIERFLRDVRGNGSTAEAELRSFLQYRNSAAHGDVDEVVATEEIHSIGEFVITLCDVLAEAVFRSVVERRLARNEAKEIGVVIHQFRDNVIGAEMRETTISTGDRLIVLRDNACYGVTVDTIQIERVERPVVVSSHGLRIGIRTSRPAVVGARLIRLHVGGQAAPQGPA